MLLLIISGLFIIGLLFQLLMKRKYSYFEDHGVPFIPPVPILGNISQAFFRKKNFAHLMVEHYKAFPNCKYYGIFNFTTPIVVLRDLDLIKSVTIKNFEYFMDHQALADDQLDPLFANNLFQMRGSRWREARNLLSPAFTGSKMKGMYELMVPCAENFVNHIKKKPEKSRGMLDTKDLFTKYTNDVIATCAFGISIDSLEKPENEFYVYGRQATKIDAIQSIKFLLARACPQIMKFFRIELISSRITRFFEKIISDTIKLRDEKRISRPDMLQLMLDARGKTSELLKLDVTEMTAQAFIFFFGGFETTSTQMCIIAHELAINPDIQIRLQEEITEVLEKSGGKPTYDQIMGMNYLDAVITESMRCHAQVGILDRLCVKKFELPPAIPGAKSLVVEPGTQIWIPVFPIQRDPQYYTDPEKFDPERFVDNNKLQYNQVTNLSFGIGPRMCIGNRFALLETKVLLFHLLANFNLRANVKTSVPFEYDTSTVTIVPKNGYWLAAYPRK